MMRMQHEEFGFNPQKSTLLDQLIESTWIINKSTLTDTEVNLVEYHVSE